MFKSLWVLVLIAMAENDATNVEPRAKPKLGHKQCSECYEKVLDLTGYGFCQECGGEFY